MAYRKKEKRATWWKMLYHQRAAISSVSDADARVRTENRIRVL